jgi:hypothetical protein
VGIEILDPAKRIRLSDHPFLRLAGAVTGPASLSIRKGFSRR